jgi:hypothetical protein
MALICLAFVPRDIATNAIRPRPKAAAAIPERRRRGRHRYIRRSLSTSNFPRLADFMDVYFSAASEWCSLTKPGSLEVLSRFRDAMRGNSNLSEPKGDISEYRLLSTGVWHSERSKTK